MRKPAKIVSTAASVVALLGSLAMAPISTAVAADNNNKSMSSIAEGKKIAFDRKKGNCLACHQIDDGALPGNIGPPLVAMKARYPDKAKLRAQIYDATQANPHTVMPPFGKNKILTESELEKVVDYIYSL